jgi:uncharacterized protein
VSSSRRKSPAFFLISMTGRLLILGASARAAAMSARRSGFECWAADRFVDTDLLATCPAERVDDYPAGFARLLERVPAGNFLYTGALENHPDLIDRLAEMRPLLGVRGEVLRRVRDPIELATALRRAGLRTPEVTLDHAGLPLDGSWLIKPLRSASGTGISAWTADARLSADENRGREKYFQRRIEGIPVGAVYIAANDRAVLLGVTRQLIGASWCGFSPDARNRFRYCGSIGSLPFEKRNRFEFERLGDVLAAEFSLVGLFGVDAILRKGAGGILEIWPVEVNPRYTASVEVLERSGGLQAIPAHVAACEQGELPIAVSAFPDRLHGKAILFAERQHHVGERFADWAAECNRGKSWPIVADIPAMGTTIDGGQPVVSLFAAGSTEADICRQLQHRIAEAKQHLE